MNSPNPIYRSVSTFLNLIVQALPALGGSDPRQQEQEASPGGFVARIGDHAQKRENILDMRLLKEAQAAAHGIGDASLHELGL